MKDPNKETITDDDVIWISTDILKDTRFRGLSADQMVRLFRNAANGIPDIRFAKYFSETGPEEGPE